MDLEPPQALMTLSSIMLGIGAVVIHTLLIGEMPAGRATTMALNQSAMNLGAALGSAVGGVLLATGGYRVLGLSALLWCAAAAALVRWSARAPRPQATTPA